MLRVVRHNDSQHFRDRLWQRHGILLIAAEMWDLRDRIFALSPTSSRGTQRTYTLRLCSKALKIVYDFGTERFVTAKLLNQEELMKFCMNSR